MACALSYQFHGVSSTEPIAAIMPPIRQEIFCGFTLEKSNSLDIKKRDTMSQ